MKNKIIKVDKITKIYKKSKHDLLIFDKASYDFELGKVYVIKGDSGAGKTTLIDMIGTLKMPNSGSIIVDSVDITTLSEGKKTKYREEKVGFVFQNFYLNEYLKAYENVMLPLLLDKKTSMQDKKEKAIKLLEELGLKNRVEHYPKELSGGEQQRVAICRALINDAKIILADEPTGSLDDTNSEKIFKLLRDLAKQGRCVLIVSHSKEAEKYADEIITIEDEKLVGVKNEK